MTEQTATEIIRMSMEMRIVVSCVIVLAAYLTDFLCCKLLIPLIRKVADRTSFKWDNYITDTKVLHNVFHLIPPIAFMVAMPMLFRSRPSGEGFCTRFSPYIS